MSNLRTRPTPDEIEAAKTPAGGWTKAQLAAWGVPWPAPKGWKQRLASGAEASAPRARPEIVTVAAFAKQRRTELRVRVLEIHGSPHIDVRTFVGGVPTKRGVAMAPGHAAELMAGLQAALIEAKRLGTARAAA